MLNLNLPLAAEGYLNANESRNNFNGCLGVELGACGFRWKARRSIGVAPGNVAPVKLRLSTNNENARA